MRIDYASMGNVMLTEVPLVADVAHGLDDLIAAIEQLMTPSIRQKAQERADEVRRVSERSKTLRTLVVDNPEWDNSPIIADRVTWEIAKFADPDAIIVHEAGSVNLHSFDFNPLGGRELFIYYGSSRLGRRHVGRREACAAEPAGHLSRRRRFVHIRPDRALEHGAARIAGHRRGVQQSRL
jgi:thiamine pyrophosphate-dependent acetolactate synthase large subunit-like protein